MGLTSSHGINYKKSYGLTPTIDAWAPLDRGTNKAGEFMYIKAAAAIAQYDFVIIDGAGNATSLTTTNSANGNDVGVSQVALAIGEYGFVWVGRGGGAGYGILGKAAAAYVLQTPMYTTATSGVVDDAATTLVRGVRGLTTLVGAGTVELQAPTFLSIG